MTLKTTRHTARFYLPVIADNLIDFLSEVPSDAAIEISVIEGGTQRDPFPIAYSFAATWERS